jgi:hypothetical protein
MIAPLKEEFGVGDLGISVMLSLALLLNGLVTVPAGYLADRWNRSRAVGHTVVGWSALSALGAAALSFPMLVTLRSALGFGQAITEPSAGTARRATPTNLRRMRRPWTPQPPQVPAGRAPGCSRAGYAGSRGTWSSHATPTEHCSPMSPAFRQLLRAYVRRR